MPDLSFLYDLIDLLPFDCLDVRFMQRAMLGLLLLAPMSAAMGVQVVNFRMAFFSDAIGHSAFAGVAVERGRLILPDGPGLGITARPALPQGQPRDSAGTTRDDVTPRGRVEGPTKSAQEIE